MPDGGSDAGNTNDTATLVDQAQSQLQFYIGTGVFTQGQLAINYQNGDILDQQGNNVSDYFSGSPGSYSYNPPQAPAPGTDPNSAAAADYAQVQATQTANQQLISSGQVIKPPGPITYDSNGNPTQAAGTPVALDPDFVSWAESQGEGFEGQQDANLAAKFNPTVGDSSYLLTDEGYAVPTPDYLASVYTYSTTHYKPPSGFNAFIDSAESSPLSGILTAVSIPTAVAGGASALAGLAGIGASATSAGYAAGITDAASASDVADAGAGASNAAIAASVAAQSYGSIFGLSASAFSKGFGAAKAVGTTAAGIINPSGPGTINYPAFPTSVLNALNFNITKLLNAQGNSVFGLSTPSGQNAGQDYSVATASTNQNTFATPQILGNNGSGIAPGSSLGGNANFLGMDPSTWLKKTPTSDANGGNS